MEKNGKNLNEIYLNYERNNNSLNLAITKFCPNLKSLCTKFKDNESLVRRNNVPLVSRNTVPLVSRNTVPFVPMNRRNNVPLVRRDDGNSSEGVNIIIKGILVGYILLGILSFICLYFKYIIYSLIFFFIYKFVLRNIDINND